VGKGYVVRRIIRRAYRFGRRLGAGEAFLYKGVPVVVKMMEEPYPYLKKIEEEIVSVIKAEEESFQATLSRGMGILETIIWELKQKKKKLIPSQDVFRLYDTYGFPVELTEEIAQEEGLRINREGYDKLLTKQRERGRKRTLEINVHEMLKVGDKAMVAKIGARRARDEITERLKQKYNLDPPKVFQGYKKLRLDTTLVAIIKQGVETEEIVQGEEGELILTSTPFYPEGGGQIGDKGKIVASNSCAEVLDTQISNEIILHRVRILRGELNKGSRVTTQVDSKRRKAIACAHTATHLLHTALRNIFGKTVKQSGSLVEEDRVRFDFSHFSPLNDEEVKRITSLVNEKIRENLPVDVEEMSLQEAQEKGAIALFEYKYKEKVRVITIGDFSREVCGGTHLSSTGKIGIMRIIGESGVASGIRRIEALVGKKALESIEEKENLLKEIARTLGTQENAILANIKEQKEKLQRQERELRKWQGRLVEMDMERLIENASRIEDIELVRGKWQNLSLEILRENAEKLKARLKKGVVVLASITHGKAFLVAASTEKRLSADEIIKDVCLVAGGSGGGRWDFAQGGTSSPEKIDTALDEIPRVVSRILSH